MNSLLFVFAFGATLLWTADHLWR